MPIRECVTIVRALQSRVDKTIQRLLEAHSPRASALPSSPLPFKLSFAAVVSQSSSKKEEEVHACSPHHKRALAGLMQESARGGWGV